jgi:hypothetical protein
LLVKYSSHHIFSEEEAHTDHDLREHILSKLALFATMQKHLVRLSSLAPSSLSFSIAGGWLLTAADTSLVPPPPPPPPPPPFASVSAGRVLQAIHARAISERPHSFRTAVALHATGAQHTI